MLPEAGLLPATGSPADVCCRGVCFLPGSASILGDGANSVGGTPSPGTQDADPAPQEKVTLGTV